MLDPLNQKMSPMKQLCNLIFYKSSQKSIELPDLKNISLKDFETTYL